MKCKTTRIRDLNDRARQSFAECRVHLTPAVRDHDSLNQILHDVQHYSSFTTDNDPYNEHDFGSFAVEDDVVFWKWDYYDCDLQYHSPDPADPNVTCRVLTIMFVDEY
ncbi:DUF3768 domain-containing protein [Yoonia vestfoldensis]|uniref:DUF3768 domain-containing protein n=1 Tax=Yoonia vestfoldensis TaxID=245188 RepID=A0A1Y0EE69_9RHOB|nr:DUF3768 domain-containing protein [Yoonia vestfoldensis]ARU01709.1 hypothetical protein LOKVESSMR4R_02405 [Yoonia vestfoldensis]